MYPKDELYPTMQEMLCMEISEQIEALEVSGDRLSNQVTDLQLAIDSINININSLVDDLEKEENKL